MVQAGSGSFPCFSLSFFLSQSQVEKKWVGAFSPHRVFLFGAFSPYSAIYYLICSWYLRPGWCCYSLLDHCHHHGAKQASLITFAAFKFLTEQLLARLFSSCLAEVLETLLSCLTCKKSDEFSKYCLPQLTQVKYSVATTENPRSYVLLTSLPPRYRIPCSFTENPTASPLPIKIDNSTKHKIRSEKHFTNLQNLTSITAATVNICAPLQQKLHPCSSNKYILQLHFLFHLFNKAFKTTIRIYFMCKLWLNMTVHQLEKVKKKHHGSTGTRSKHKVN